MGHCVIAAEVAVGMYFSLHRVAHRRFSLIIWQLLSQNFEPVWGGCPSARTPVYGHQSRQPRNLSQPKAGPDGHQFPIRCGTVSILQYSVNC